MSTAAEVVLKFMPQRLFVQLPKAFGEADADPELEDNVYALKPAHRVWHVDKAGHLRVCRHGFELAPDFGGTAHGYCGSTLRACVGDPFDFAHTPTREDMLKSYITLSRVRTAETLLVAQPFSPMVFRQGLLPGPHLLMEFWRGCLSMKQVQEAWSRAEQKENKQKSNL